MRLIVRIGIVAAALVGPVAFSSAAQADCLHSLLVPFC
jgi:hypothetical protein